MQKTLGLLLVLSFSFSIHAQQIWQDTPSLDSFPVYDFHPTDDGLLIALSGGGIQKTIDEGASWQDISFEGGLEGNTFFSDFAQIGNTIYVASRRRVASQKGGIFKSNDDGETWQAAYDDNLHKDVRAIVSIGNRLVAGTQGGIFISDDKGETWEKIDFDKGGARYHSVHSMANNGNVIVAGGNRHVFTSLDAGETWQSIKIVESTDVVRAAYANGKFYMGTSGRGVHVSEDGLEWEKLELGLGENQQNIASFLRIGEDQYYSAAGNIYKNGVVMNEGFDMPNPIVRSFTIYKNVLYAGTFWDGVWKYDLPENESANAPVIELQPNPSASDQVLLTYEVAEESKVLIALYDQNGKQIQVIANEEMQTGTYQIEVDVSSLNNGNYYFHFQSKNQEQTQSLIVAN